MIITREKGMRMWGGGSGSTSTSGVNGGGGFSLAVTEGEGTGNAYTGFTYESGVLSLIKGTQFVTTDFFNRLFTAYDANGTAIVPNDTTTAINNLKLMVGTWTEEYLSALGKNSEGGGGGGGIELSDVWQSLKTNTDDYANQKINAAHIPDLSGTYATKTWVNQQGFVTSSGVTSVAMTVPTGLAISGSPITTTGTLALTFATGYSIPTTAKQGNWDTAYGWGNHASAGYAMGTTNIIAGNGLTGGGTLAADRTLAIKLVTSGSTNTSGLAVSSSGLKLDIINNLTTESAYKAISATQAKKIWDLLNQMFTLEGAGTTASPYVIKANYGLYTEQFLSALGQNSSGGGGGDFDEAQMWAALQSTSGTYATTKIATSHIPDIASTYGYLKSSALNGYATQVWVNQQGFLTTHQTLYTLSIYGGTTKVLDFKPNANASIYIKAGGDISLTNDTTNKYITLSYTHPTNGANTTISAASGKVLSAITVNNLGHVTSVSCKTLASADIPDLSSTYATAARATTLEGYFTNGVANTAAKLNTGTTTYTAWGQTYWSSGVPQNVSGHLYMNNNNFIYWKDKPSSGTATNMSILEFSSANNLHVGYGSSGLGYPTYINGNVVYLRYGTSRTIGLTLSSAGVVSIPSTGTLKIGDCSITWDSTNNMLKFDKGIYSTGAVSALGANSSGGGGGTFDEEAMWTALGTTSTAKVIASSHIPNLAASKITSGTLAAARIPIATASAIGGIKVGTTLAISDGVLNQKSGIATAGTYKSVTVDTYGRVTDGTNPTTLSGYGVLDDANGRYYALYGGTKLNNSLSSTNKIDLDDYVTPGSYYCSAIADSDYISNKPIRGAFRMWVTSSNGVDAHYRQRYQLYNSMIAYERWKLSGNAWTEWYTVQDNLANYALASSLNNYLPLSGGTLTGGLVVGGVLYTNGFAHMIKFDVDTSRALGYAWWDTNSNTVASIVYHNTAQNIILNPIGSSNTYSDAVGKYSLFIGNNKLTYNTYTILHSNNTYVSSGKGYINGTEITTISGNAATASLLSYSHTNEINFKGGMQVNCYFNYRNADTNTEDGDTTAINYKFCNYTRATAYSTVTAGTFVGAFSGNATTATTLQTSRTIWGQSFNGGAAVRGTLSMFPDTLGMNNDTAKLWFRANTTDEGDGYSPYIQGIYQATTGRKRLSVFQINNANYTGTHTEVFTILPNGRVGIGTTAPSYLLHVNGTVAGTECRATSDIRKKNIKGDIHLDVADIANAPSILFTWKDKVDDDIHGGTTAQYWKPIAPYYVNTGEDGIMDLNYAGLALSSAIECAKMLLKHDDEIEILKNENKILKQRVIDLERRVA